MEIKAGSDERHGASLPRVVFPLSWLERKFHHSLAEIMDKIAHYSPIARDL